MRCENVVVSVHAVVIGFAGKSFKKRLYRNVFPEMTMRFCSANSFIPEGDDVESLLRGGYRLVAFDSLMTAERGGNREPFEFAGKLWDPGEKNNWKTSPSGMKELAEQNRIVISGNTLRYKRFLNDFPANPITTAWTDTTTFSQRIYCVQTIPKVIQRCLLMSTDPGDLVLDPTCGSGTTAFVAEQWGRR